MEKPSENKWHLIARLLDGAAEAIMITDANSRITYVNRSFTRVTGYGPADVAGKTPRILHSGRQNAAFYARMWKSLRTSGLWQGEIWNRRKGGEIYPEWLSISAVGNKAGKTEHYLAIFSDITLRKQEERQLYDRATHDALTGLPNRFLFGEQLTHALARAKRAGHPVGLLYLDLDRFKPVNDRHGHGCGDVLLQTVAKRLRRSVREEDMIARLGGDEFAVILEHLSGPRDAVPTARKILRALARPFVLGRSKAAITASIGISVFPFDGNDVETLMKRADRAMYEAKAGHGNDYRFSGNPSLYSLSRRKPSVRGSTVGVPPRPMRQA